MRRRTIAALCLASLAFGPVVASAAERSRTAPGDPVGAKAAGVPAGEAGDYRIGPEDVLYVSVWKNETLSREVPVRPDGMISLPLLNDVQAAGLTPMELRESLMKKLGDYVSDAEVSVIVVEVRSPKVSVLGQVAHPGRYDLKGRTTVLDLLAVAGGLTEFAARSRIVVLRPGGSPGARLRFDYDKAMREGARENFELRAGDIVLVQ